MLQRFLVVALFLLAGSSLSASVPVAAAASDSDTPAPFTLQGSPRSLGGGIQQAWQVKVDESRAMDAIFKGGMWLPDGAGGRIYARYASHILHPDGDWTWIGKVATKHGEQSVVITFGKDAVFGRIPQTDDYPLRLETEHGRILLVRTNGAALSRSAAAVAMQGKTDARAVPRRKSTATTGSSAPAVADVQAQAGGAVSTNASTNANTLIDVMVAYTPGIVSEYGSVSAALTRINNLVSIANQAYIDSKVNQQIRLVNTVEVNYPDNTSDDSALDDITGRDSAGNPVPVPPSLQSIAGLRAKYGADLVSLLRKYDNATNGGCGLAWIIGGGLQPIVPSHDYIYGYSVVGDGQDGSYYCLDTSFAHELGHNMGDEHDRANAGDQQGAYPYSYGYIGNGTNGFATIMAYGSPTQTPLAVFSNPNISICQNTPCGVADSSSNSADNAHSMNNTASLIAQFEPTMTSVPTVHNDVNGDGLSDLLWRSNNNTQFAYWLMNGTQLMSSLAIPTPSSYTLVATGDFNDDGLTEIIWSDGTSLYMWVGNGSSFTNVYMRPYPTGWKLVGTGDLNDDGFTDLLWANGTQIAEWLMNGTNFKASYRQNLASGWRYLTAGDFDGDGRTDLLLTNGSAMQMWTNFNNGSFTTVATHAYPIDGWTILGTGDVNGDGKYDLLWRDSSQTHFAYWIMNGSQLAGSWMVAVTPEWKFGTSGDFNGDGLLDLIWYNTSQIVMWPGNTTGVYKGVAFYYYPAGGWTMLP